MPKDLGSSSLSLQRPYPPSWFDRMDARVSRLAAPRMAYYLGLSVLLLLATTAVQWWAGGLALGRVNSFHAWLALQDGLILWFMGYLDRWAGQAMDRVRPVFVSSADDFDDLQYRLTTVAARPVLIASLLGGAFAFLPFYLISRQVQGGLVAPIGVSADPWTVRITLILLVMAWCCLGALIAHSIHQLQVISQVYARHVRIDLFELSPLYAFSGVTMRTSIGLLVINYLWFATSPGLLRQPISIAIAVILALLATATFFAPLLGIHGRLVAEKQRQQAEVGHRVQATVDALFQDMDTGRTERVSTQREQLTALDLHARTLERIPTWPWQPDAVRLLLTALLLPLAIFVIQLIVQRALPR